MTLTPGWLSTISRKIRKLREEQVLLVKKCRERLWTGFLLKLIYWNSVTSRFKWIYKQSRKCPSTTERMSRFWGVLYLLKWWMYPMCGTENTFLVLLGLRWKMTIWESLACIVINALQLSVKFEKTKTWRISKLQRQVKGIYQRFLSRRVKSLEIGKESESLRNKRQQSSRKGVFQYHSVEESCKMRLEKRP